MQTESAAQPLGLPYKALKVYFVLGHARGEINYRVILKDYGDGTHYYISSTSKDHRAGVMNQRGVLNEFEIRMAGYSVRALMSDPMKLRYSTCDSRAVHFDRGVGKNESLEQYTTSAVVDFEHGLELYERLMRYDEAIKRLEAPYPRGKDE